MIVQRDRALRPWYETDDHVEGSGLACAIRSQQTHDFAARDFDRKIFDDLPRAIAFRETLEPAIDSCTALGDQAAFLRSST